jgi:uncharacterized protein YbcI
VTSTVADPSRSWSVGKEVIVETQDEIEAAIRERIARFQREYMGMEPRDVRAHLINDLVMVRVQGALTVAERDLVKSLPAASGRDMLKRLRTQLLETMRPMMEAVVQGVTGVNVLSLHHDVSTVTGEEVIVFTLSAPVGARGTSTW